MPREISFLYTLSSDLHNRLRVNAWIEKGIVTGFVVQYEAFIQDQWRPIVRYDTAHGFAHRDLIHPKGEAEKQPLYFPNLNLAFTFAIQDLKMLWGRYRAGYEGEMRREED
ncbi:MAG: hypothetical protein HY998_07275 [candidate division NC10 bacterium]|nr:hypothetical protein [candidate division NC10 bacterium]